MIWPTTLTSSLQSQYQGPLQTTHGLAYTLSQPPRFLSVSKFGFQSTGDALENFQPPPPTEIAQSFQSEHQEYKHVLSQSPPIMSNAHENEFQSSDDIWEKSSQDVWEDLPLNSAAISSPSLAAFSQASLAEPELNDAQVELNA